MYLVACGDIKKNLEISSISRDSVRLSKNYLNNNVLPSFFFPLLMPYRFNYLSSLSTGLRDEFLRFLVCYGIMVLVTNVAVSFGEYLFTDRVVFN